MKNKPKKTQKVVLGKENPAPRNRTLRLFKKDFKKYTDFLTLPKKERILIDEVRNQIILGNCIKGMSKLPEKSIDLIFADPPYYKIDRDFGEGTVRLSKEEYLEWSDRWIKEAARLLKETGSMYVCCGWQSSGDIQKILDKYLIVKNRVTWQREKGRGANKNWKENMEDIWFAVKSKKYIFNINKVKIKKEIIAPYRYGGKGGKPKGWVEKKGERYRYTHPSNIWTDITVPFWSMREKTPHPTQKPEKILKRIILANSNKGDLVLDPFMGSGTTAVVAKRLGRDYVGFEVNKDYVILSLKRLDKRLEI